MPRECLHLRAALQRLLKTTVPCAALCWMSCKCNHFRAAPQAFRTTTAPCVALWWMSDVVQVQTSSRCTASFQQAPNLVPRCAGSWISCKCKHPHATPKACRKHGTLCGAVLDVLRMQAPSRCTARFPHNHGTLCRVVRDDSPSAGIVALHRKLSAQPRHLVPIGDLPSASIFAPHRKFCAQPRHLAPRCGGRLRSCKCKHLALEGTFSAKPRHIVPSYAGRLASASIFALHRTEPRHLLPRCGE